MRVRRPGRYRSYTFVPLFAAPHDQDAADELRDAADPDAACPVQVATMPVSGLSFFEATGDAARHLDRIWAQQVPIDSCPVVLLVHQDGLADYLAGLDAEFVIGVEDGDAEGCYGAFANVHVVMAADPLEITRTAMREWTENGERCFRLAWEPGDTARGRDPLTHDLRHDRDLIDALFGGPPEKGGEGLRQAGPGLGAGPELAPESPAPAPPVDPLAGLAAIKPAAVYRPAPSSDRPLPPAEPVTRHGLLSGAQQNPSTRNSARGWIDRARLLVAGQRPVEVPSEIGDLLLGARPSPVVVVGSRKGGVGKTALSAGLAQVCGYSLDGRAGVAALVDQNINNADQWGRLMVPPGVTTVRQIMTVLENGEEFPPAPAFARTPALAVYPESRDPGDGYPAALIERFLHNLRNRYVVTVVDLPNTLPAYTSAEASVAAAYINHADLVLVPTTDDPNALRGVLDYLDAPSMRSKTAVVPYIVSTERGIREDPRVLELLEQIGGRSAAVIPFPKTEKATLAIVKGTSILDVDTRLRNAFIELASATAGILARGAG